MSLFSTQATPLIHKISLLLRNGTLSVLVHCKYDGTDDGMAPTAHRPNFTDRAVPLSFSMTANYIMRELTTTKRPKQIFVILYKDILEGNTIRKPLMGRD